MAFVENIVVDRRWPTEVLLVLRRHLACPTRDQSRSWLQTIERGLSQALKRYSLTTRGPKNRILVDLKQDSRGPKTGFHAFGMYIHNDTLLALGRQTDQFGDTGIPFRPVIGLLGQELRTCNPSRCSSYTGPSLMGHGVHRNPVDRSCGLLEQVSRTCNPSRCSSYSRPSHGTIYLIRDANLTPGAANNSPRARFVTTLLQYPSLAT
jgi:hypothetical protein